MNKNLEYVYEVTEEDKIIKKITRKQSIEEILLHRGVVIFLLSLSNEIFIHKRSLNKELFPGFWDGSVGGAVRWGETYEQAAKRELKEEAGIDGKIQFMTSIKYRSEKLKYNGKIYFCKTDQSISFSTEEIETWEWIDITQLENELKIKKFIPDFLAIWKEVKDVIMTMI